MHRSFVIQTAVQFVVNVGGNIGALLCLVLLWSGFYCFACLGTGLQMFLELRVMSSELASGGLCKLKCVIIDEITDRFS